MVKYWVSTKARLTNLLTEQRKKFIKDSLLFIALFIWIAVFGMFLLHIGFYD